MRVGAAPVFLAQGPPLRVLVAFVKLRKLPKMTDLVRRPHTYMYLTYLRVGRGAQLAATHIAPV